MDCHAKPVKMISIRFELYPVLQYSLYCSNRKAVANTPAMAEHRVGGVRALHVQTAPRTCPFELDIDTGYRFKKKLSKKFRSFDFTRVSNLHITFCPNEGKKTVNYIGGHPQLNFESSTHREDTERSYGPRLNTRLDELRSVRGIEFDKACKCFKMLCTLLSNRLHHIQSQGRSEALRLFGPVTTIGQCLLRG